MRRQKERDDIKHLLKNDEDRTEFKASTKKIIELNNDDDDDEELEQQR